MNGMNGVELSKVITTVSAAVKEKENENIKTDMTAIDDALESEYDDNSNSFIISIEGNLTNTKRLTGEEKKYVGDFLAEQAIVDTIDLDTFIALGLNIVQKNDSYNMDIDPLKYKKSNIYNYSIESQLKLIDMFFTIELIRVINNKIREYFKAHDKWFNFIKIVNMIIGILSIVVTMVVSLGLTDKLPSQVSGYLPLITGIILVANYIIGRLSLSAGINVDRYYTLQKQITKLRFYITTLMLDNKHKINEDQLDNKLSLVKHDLKVLNNLDSTNDSVNKIFNKIETEVENQKKKIYEKIGDCLRKHLSDIENVINTGCIQIEIKNDVIRHNEPIFV